MSLENKIDFAVILSVKHANPNGDPLNGNRPRVDYEGYGEISDVCLKRKIRDRLQDNKQSIFVQSDEKKIDGMPSLKARAESEEFGLGKNAFLRKKTSPDEAAKLACAKWLDVRTFGQLFAFKGSGNDGVSIPIRGPVSIHSAFSVDPVSITSSQITKSVSGEGDGTKKSSDTMGMKHRVDKAVYVTYGSMNPQLSERTGFSNDDAEIIKEVLPKLFEGDASSARPEGSMAVEKVIWWQHNCKSGQYSSAKVHRTLDVHSDGTFELENLEGLEPDIIEGF
jgi:CRISPR-associated protein Csd2